MSGETPQNPSAPEPSEGSDQAEASQPPAAEGLADLPPAPDDDTPDADSDSDFEAPFVGKTFGGAFVWARGQNYVATVLRVREGKSVPVATQNRRDMIVMLTGGRAVLEVDSGGDLDRVELLPASPIPIDGNHAYRLIALTEVELFTVYSPIAI